MITRRQLELLSAYLGPRDFTEYAGRVSSVDPVLGRTVELHAAAADSNSPDLCEWPRHTYDDAMTLAHAKITTPEGAEAWYSDRYAPTRV